MEYMNKSGAGKAIADKAKIEELLSRGVDTVYPTRDALRDVLMSGKRIRLYLGIDPTSPHLHLGHAENIIMLRKFQDLGHEVILLMGDFTGRIGDPTDKLAARTQLTDKQVKENLKTFKAQASKVLRFTGANAAQIKFNAKWLGKLTFEEVIKLASHFTVQQMLERDMFQKRLNFTYTCPKCGKEQIYAHATPRTDGGIRSVEHGSGLTKSRVCTNCGAHNTFEAINNAILVKKNANESEGIRAPRPIGLHEFFYPLMQGYDSVAMDVDLEVGGTDQTFNMLAGRTLLKAMKGKEKFVITNRLLEDPTTGKKMSKTEGTLVNLDDEPNDMFGKIMALPDELIPHILELSTMIPIERVTELTSKLKKGENPRDIKLIASEEVVALYHSPKLAKEAREEWVRVFSHKEKPEDAPKLKLKTHTLSLIDLVLAAGIPSKSEARRLVEQNAVKINDAVKKDSGEMITLKPRDIIRIGKHRFFEIA